MRPVLGAERHVFAILLSTQRSAPPTLVLIVLIAWIWVTPPVNIDTVRVSLFAQFALAAWLGHATGGSEDPAQELISTSHLGSATRLLLAKWLTATAIAAAVPLVILAGTFSYDQFVLRAQLPRFTPEQAVASAVAFVVVAVTGASLGVLATSTLPRHPGWATVALAILSLAQAAPWMAPVTPLAAALPARGQPLPAVLAPTVALGLLGGGALLAAARIIRRPAG